MPTPRAVSHCILRRAGKVLLIRIEDPDTGEFGWRAPGGGIEWLETSEQALHRELKEELDLELASWRLRGVVEGFIRWRGVDEHELVFVYEALPHNWGHLEADRVAGVEAAGRALDLHWVDPAELVARGERMYPEAIVPHLLGHGPRHVRPVALCALEHKGHYLVFKAWDAVKRRYFARFPGGGIEYGESADEGLRREMREELDTELEGVRLLGTMENIFTFEGQPGHEVVFVFSARALNPAVYSGELSFAQDDGGPVPLFWLTREQLSTPDPELVPPGILDLLD